MPNQNQPDPNQPANQPVNQPAASNVPPVISPQADLPPLPPEFQNIPSGGAPTLTTDQSAPAGSAAPPDISSVISKPKKKFAGGKIIATILGLLLLVGGVGAGIILTQQQQLLQQKAATICINVSSNCVQNLASLGCPPSGNPDYKCNGGEVAGTAGNVIKCCKEQTTPVTITYNCTNGSCQPVTGAGGTYATLERCQSSCSSNVGGSTCPPSNDPNCSGGNIINGPCGDLETIWTCSPTGGVTLSCCKPKTGGGGGGDGGGAACTFASERRCIGNVETGECYQGGDNKAYACYKLLGNYGQLITGTGTYNQPQGTTPRSCPDCSCTAAGYNWGPIPENGGCWCFDTNSTCDGQAPYAERCSLTPQQCSATPPPSSPPTAPMCVAVKAYDVRWNLLTSAQLSVLTPGVEINFCVTGSAPSGTFDKAQFTIKGVQQPETTTQRPSSTDFCQSYTIQASDTTVTVTAKIHHSTLGWY
jgi:hypothetical protein